MIIRSIAAHHREPSASSTTWSDDTRLALVVLSDISFVELTSSSIFEAELQASERLTETLNLQMLNASLCEVTGGRTI